MKTTLQTLIVASLFIGCGSGTIRFDELPFADDIETTSISLPEEMTATETTVNEVIESAETPAQVATNELEIVELELDEFIDEVQNEDNNNVIIVNRKMIDNDKTQNNYYQKNNAYKNRSVHYKNYDNGQSCGCDRVNYDVNGHATAQAGFDDCQKPAREVKIYHNNYNDVDVLIDRNIYVFNYNDQKNSYDFNRKESDNLPKTTAKIPASDFDATPNDFANEVNDFTDTETTSDTAIVKPVESGNGSTATSMPTHQTFGEATTHFTPSIITQDFGGVVTNQVPEFNMPKTTAKIPASDFDETPNELTNALDVFTDTETTSDTAIVIPTEDSALTFAPVTPIHNTVVVAQDVNLTDDNLTNSNVISTATSTGLQTKVQEVVNTDVIFGNNAILQPQAVLQPQSATENNAMSPHVQTRQQARHQTNAMQ